MNEKNSFCNRTIAKWRRYQKAKGVQSANTVMSGQVDIKNTIGYNIEELNTYNKGA